MAKSSSGGTIDGDKIRRHIFDCLNVLSSSEKLRPSMREHKAKVFYGALIEICQAQLRKINSSDNAIDGGVMLLLKENFGAASAASTIQFEAADGDWMPTTWACMIEGIDKETVRDLLFSEPALKSTRRNSEKQKVTSLHYAAAAEKPNFDAIDVISSPCNMRVRDTNNKVPLHWAAQYSRSLSMIQYLIQADPTVIRLNDRNSRLPIEYLLERKPFPEKQAMIKLLGEADPEAIAFSSNDKVPVFYNALSTLCGRGPCDDLLETAEVLLALHPKAVCLPGNDFERLPLHSICARDEDEAFPLAEMIMALHPESVKLKGYFGQLPVHIAAESSSPKLLKSLLGHYPESLHIRSINQRTLIHIAASNSSPYADEVIKCIADLDSTLVSIKDENDKLPIHYACSDGSLTAVKVLYELYPQGIREADDKGRLPVHLLIRKDALNNMFIHEPPPERRYASISSPALSRERSRASLDG